MFEIIPKGCVRVNEKKMKNIFFSKGKTSNLKILWIASFPHKLVLMCLTVSKRWTFTKHISLQVDVI